MLVSPIAFAAELKTVKVSELKPGQIIVDKEGNEIKVETLKTQAKEYPTISEILNQLVTRNPATLPSGNNLDSYVGDNSNGLGIGLTGKVITGMLGADIQSTTLIKNGVTYNVDIISTPAGYTYRGTSLDGTTYWEATGENSGVASNALYSLLGDGRTAKIISASADLASEQGSQGDPLSPERLANYDINYVDDGTLKFNEMNSPTPGTSSLPVSTGGWDGVDRMTDVVALPAPSKNEDKVTALGKEPSISEGTKITSIIKPATATEIAAFEKEWNIKYDPSKGYATTESGALVSEGKVVSRGTVQTSFGEMGFFGGQLVQGVQWAVIVGGMVSFFGGITGAQQSEVNALSTALAAGIMAGKLSYAVLGSGGIGGFTEGTFWSSPTTSGVIGGATAWLVYNSQWKKETTRTEIVNFQCMPWQAPHGGQDCELCNSDPTLPCSEYKCKSLGQSCDIINAGTTSERCYNKNIRDVAPPVIKPWPEALNPPSLTYSDVKENPPGAGFKLKSKETTTGCIKPYTPIEFGIVTNEPAQCKIDYVEGKNYSQMTTYFSGSNLYEYNHSESLSLPSAESFKNSSLVLENGKELRLFMKCRDAQGNTNEADYELSLCVDPSPDQTPPLVSATSIPAGSCVAATSQNSTVDFYINEPAECRWSPQDQSFENMKNNMSCSSSITEINALQLYPCTTLLTGIAQGGSDFYVRCKDQPGAPENKTNKNMESYKFSLRGSNPLKMGTIYPNETIYGSVNPMPVELKTTTLFGCDNNKAVCYYSPTGSATSYVQFFDTNKDDGVHTQRLDLSSGTYTYFVKCVDAGGNVAETPTTFKVDVDPNAPMIARVYEEDSYLKIITPQNSKCYFSNENCDFLSQEGTTMPYEDSTTHVTPWLSDKTYYIKCEDEFRSTPTDCSLIVKPTDNFL